jgi:hypothetical protein
VLGWLVELLRAPLAPSSPVVAVETTSGMHQAWVSELERQVAQQRLHDQLNRLCPGLSATVGHGRPRSATAANSSSRTRPARPCWDVTVPQLLQGRRSRAVAGRRRLP